jgi:hypothetical protein
MHDSLVALSVLANEGKMKAVNLPLIMYRQHDNNVLGAIVNCSFLFRILNLNKILKSYYGFFRGVNSIKSISLFNYPRKNFC